MREEGEWLEIITHVCHGDAGSSFSHSSVSHVCTRQGKLNPSSLLFKGFE
ncbi:MAG: hypothetical protein HNEKOMLI_00099 [Sodalis sp. Psp]|nr:hypothetical protein [Sodalis sp. Psp]MCR3756604.1 hypothetical protein [Sodalis sp. Ppy]